MRRPRRALAAIPFVLLLAACGSSEATQGSVRDDVKDALLEREVDPIDDEEVAAEVADCVSRGMFESEEFSKDERNDATRAVDGDDPDPDLVNAVQTLVTGCEAEVEAGGGEPSDEDSTTTTEG